jgi:hypothetical protein
LGLDKGPNCPLCTESEMRKDTFRNHDKRQYTTH